MEKLNEIEEHFYTPLFTDFYQITMAYAYFKNGMHEQDAIFEAYFRKTPFKGKYAVFAGLDELIVFLKRFRFSEQDIKFLKE